MCLIWARFTVARAVCSSSFPLVCLCRCHCQLHKILVHFCIVHGCGKDQRRHTHTMLWHNGIMTTIFFYGPNTHNMCAHKHKLTNVTLSFFRGCFLCSSLLLCVCAKHQNPIRFIWERAKGCLSHHFHRTLFCMLLQREHPFIRTLSSFLSLSSIYLIGSLKSHFWATFIFESACMNKLNLIGFSAWHFVWPNTRETSTMLHVDQTSHKLVLWTHKSIYPS